MVSGTPCCNYCSYEHAVDYGPASLLMQLMITFNVSQPPTGPVGVIIVPTRRLSEVSQTFPNRRVCYSFVRAFGLDGLSAFM